MQVGINEVIGRIGIAETIRTHPQQRQREKAKADPDNESKIDVYDGTLWEEWQYRYIPDYLVPNYLTNYYPDTPQRQGQVRVVSGSGDFDAPSTGGRQRIRLL